MICRQWSLLWKGCITEFTYPGLIYVLTYMHYLSIWLINIKCKWLIASPGGGEEGPSGSEGGVGEE